MPALGQLCKPGERIKQILAKSGVFRHGNFTMGHAVFEGLAGRVFRFPVNGHVFQAEMQESAAIRVCKGKCHILAQGGRIFRIRIIPVKKDFQVRTPPHGGPCFRAIIGNWPFCGLGGIGIRALLPGPCFTLAQGISGSLVILFGLAISGFLVPRLFLWQSANNLRNVDIGVFQKLAKRRG